MKATGHPSVWTGFIAAFAASSCCILPLVAAIGGASSGFASSLAWVDPLRPYLIATTLGLFGLAFYRAYRPKETDDCGCEVKPSFWQSKAFLWSVFSLSLLLMAFPYYSKVFLSFRPICIGGNRTNDWFPNSHGEHWGYDLRRLRRTCQPRIEQNLWGFGKRYFVWCRKYDRKIRSDKNPYWFYLWGSEKSGIWTDFR